MLLGKRWIGGGIGRRCHAARGDPGADQRCTIGQHAGLARHDPPACHRDHHHNQQWRSQSLRGCRRPCHCRENPTGRCPCRQFQQHVEFAGYRYDDHQLSPFDQDHDAVCQIASEHSPVSWRHRIDDGDDGAEKRLGHCRQHTEHRRDHPHQGQWLPAGAQRQWSAEYGMGRPHDQWSVGQYGDRRQWLDRHAVHQHGRVRRARSGRARCHRLIGDRKQGDRPAPPAFDPPWTAAGDHQPDRGREWFRPASG